MSSFKHQECLPVVRQDPGPLSHAHSHTPAPASSPDSAVSSAEAAGDTEHHQHLSTQPGPHTPLSFCRRDFHFADNLRTCDRTDSRTYPQQVEAYLNLQLVTGLDPLLERSRQRQQAALVHVETMVLITADDVEGEWRAVPGRVPVRHHELEEAAADRLALLQGDMTSPPFNSSCCYCLINNTKKQYTAHPVLTHEKCGEWQLLCDHIKSCSRSA